MTNNSLFKTSQDIELTGLINEADLSKSWATPWDDGVEEYIELKFCQDDVGKSPLKGPVCKVWHNLWFYIDKRLTYSP